MSISRKTLSNPVLVLVVFTLLGVMGIFTFKQIEISLLPDISFPELMVTTTYTNADPESVENSVTKVIEDSLVSINNLKKMTSVSSEGSSTINLEFQYGTNLDAATNQVRDSLDSIRDILPKSVRTPSIMKANMNDMPLVFIAVRGHRSTDELRYISENEIKNILAQANGVAQVAVSGGRMPIVRVELSQNRLAAYGFTLSTIAAKLALENIDLGAGKITEGSRDFVIRTTGEYTSIEEINNTAISTMNGYTVRLSDVGRAYMGYSDAEEQVFVNGAPGIYLAVTKQSGTNSVKVADSLYEKIEETQRLLPDDIQLDIISDDTVTIRETLRTLLNTAWQGILLAVLILFVFLKSFKSTFIISISIPFSILLTLLLMHTTHIKLNIMTLTGLILGIGMVVDASVVMIDNIYVYRMRGTKPKVAAILGSQEMISSVISGNLTTVVVFVPFLLYMKELDYMGQMFKDMIFTIVIAILSSLFVAIFLVPVLAGKYLPLTNREEKPVRTPLLRKLYGTLDSLFNKIIEIYRFVLHASLAHRGKAVLISFLALAGSLALIPKLQVNLIPETEAASVSLDIVMPTGTSLELTTAVVKKLEAIIKSEVKGYKTLIVSAGAADDVSDTANSYKGRVTIYLPVAKKQIDSESVIKRKLSSHFQEFPEAKLSFGKEEMDSITGSALDVVVRSTDLDAAFSVSKKIKAAMQKITDIDNIKIDMEEGLPQIEIDIDRQRAAAFGISIEDAATEINNCIAGITATKYRSNGKEYNIVLMYQKQDRQQVIDLGTIQVKGTHGIVPLSNFATIVKKMGPVSIRRENRIRTIHITAGIVSKTNANVIENMIKKNVASSYIIPQGVTVSYEGSWKTMKKQGSVFFQIIVLAILLVFGVMAGTYGSFKAPLINMMTIPFMLIGVIVIYVIMGQPVSIMTMVGLIMLVGIVVNNGIILVDYTNLLIDRGYKMKEACLEAGASRLRPVLMTTLTTILGMLPMSFTTAGSAALVQPIGLCVLGGLSSSTFITLFFIPVLYSLVMKEKKTEKKVLPVDTLSPASNSADITETHIAYRCDIIANQSVQDDIIELLEASIEDIQYTIHQPVFGRGIKKRKLGTTTWPELNFELYTYIKKEDLPIIRTILAATQRKFPDEGIQLFVMQVC